MATLFITSSEAGAGKTAVSAGLAQHLLSNGKKVGFFKPLITDNASATVNGFSRDAVFMKQILTLDEPIDNLCPIISVPSNTTNQINQAYARVSRDKDVVIVEVPLDDTTRGMVETLDARLINVEEYDRISGSKLTDIYSGFGERLLGVVLNKVPKSRLERMPDKGEKNLLGVLPEDRLLFTLTVGELAESLKGEILNSADKSDELVENFMLGAMTVDCGPEYFGRKGNKAVVVRGDRPDMQMAALETSLRCLILCGGVAPVPLVRHQSESKGIPIILTQGDTAATIASIEDVLARVRFNQDKKLPKLAEIMGQHFDFKAVYKGLGLAA